MMPKQPISPRRMAEYNAIKDQVDERAKQLTRQALGLIDDEWPMGACHTYWHYRKKILREEYHMVWRSPEDLRPGVLFD